MLDPVNPWGRPVPAELALPVGAAPAREAWQLASYYELRHEIFVREQRLFDESDRDEHDARATPIVAQGQIAGMPDRVVGVVRIYETAPGVWFGGRLGVARAYRRVRAVGSGLIREAVASAHLHGCRRFLATVQEQNRRYFERHRFRPLHALTLRGHPHWLMEAELDAYPPSLASWFHARAS